MDRVLTSVTRGVLKRVGVDLFISPSFPCFICSEVFVEQVREYRTSLEIIVYDLVK